MAIPAPKEVTLYVCPKCADWIGFGGGEFPPDGDCGWNPDGWPHCQHGEFAVPKKPVTYVPTSQLDLTDEMIEAAGEAARLAYQYNRHVGEAARWECAAEAAIKKAVKSTTPPQQEAE